MDKYISVIIPTYNKNTRLKLALMSLEKQDFPISQWEAVLVDDGSTENVMEVVRQLNLSFDLKYIRQKNSGRSVARNNGIRESSGKILLFMDDDLIASPRLLSCHAELHRKMSDLVVHGAIYELTYFKFFQDPVNGILYPEFKNYEKKVKGLKSKCKQIFEFENNFLHFSQVFKKKSRFEHAIESILSLPRNKQAVPWIAFTGGNISIEREILNDVGNFDPNLGKVWGAEDIELGYRVNKKNVTWIYSNCACNYHISHYRRNVFEIGKGPHEYCVKKHPSKGMEYLWEFLTGELSIDEYNSIVMEEEDNNENEKR